MADLVQLNPGGKSEAVAAEPDERSRLMFICMVGFCYLAIDAFFKLAKDFHRYVMSRDLMLCGAQLDLTTSVLTLPSSVPSFWLSNVLMALVAEWFHGNPEGRRLVDDLLQYDRWLFDEPIHGGGDAAAVQAEPAECSRRAFICLVGCLTVTLGVILARMFVFEKSQPTLSTAGTVFVVLLTGAISFLFARCFGKFALLLIDWHHGNPEGKRLVDRLIQSDWPLVQML